MKIEIRENKKAILEKISEDDLLFLSRSIFESKIKVRKLSGGLGYEIYPDNVVGALSLPSGNQINISPKIPLPNLFKMMSYVGGLYEPLEYNVEYDLDKSLFDILAMSFAREFSHILRVGMKQGYATEENVMRTLKGQILFSSSISKGLIGSDKLVCRLQKLTLDTPLNRAIVTAANLILSSEVVAPESKKRVRHCLNQIPSDLISSNFKIDDFKGIDLDRTTSFYEKIIFISRFIISSTSYNDKFGNNRFPGFLLDMSILFEKYVSTALKDTHNVLNLKISSQAGTHLDLGKEVEIRPDLMFLSNGKVKYIADTKYKDFSDLKFRNEDVYQMLAYLLRHRCREGFLIYPAFNTCDIGLLKTIHIDTELGEMSVHGICIDLSKPSTAVENIENVLNTFSACNIEISS